MARKLTQDPERYFRRTKEGTEQEKPHEKTLADWHMMSAKDSRGKKKLWTNLSTCKMSTTEYNSNC